MARKIRQGQTYWMVERTYNFDAYLETKPTLAMAMFGFSRKYGAFRGQLRELTKEQADVCEVFVQRVTHKEVQYRRTIRSLDGSTSSMDFVSPRTVFEHHNPTLMLTSRRQAMRQAQQPYNPIPQ
jgi:hypothetical protein